MLQNWLVPSGSVSLILRSGLDAAGVIGSRRSLLDTQQPPFYGHCTGQPVSVKNWRILLVQSFTARMLLLAATSTFGLG